MTFRGLKLFCNFLTTEAVKYNNFARTVALDDMGGLSSLELQTRKQILLATSK
jgi:hypothetical protein